MRDVLTKFRIKSGCLKKVRKVLREVEKRRHEMHEIMGNTGIIQDCSFIESSPRGDFLYIYKRLASLDRLKKQIQDSAHPLYQYVREQLLPCLGKRLDLPCLVAFDRENRW